ncbi:MAG: hypothetical protein IM638_06475 [Bacteroidetes bacterium]|nr:hypothetical protein [Bacteroidota bacterium]
MKLPALVIAVFSVLYLPAQIQVASEKNSPDYRHQAYYGARFLLEDKTGYYLFANNNAALSYQHLNRELEIDREEIITNAYKRTGGRKPMTAFCNQDEIIELSYDVQTPGNIINYFAQKIDLHTLKPKGDAKLLYSVSDYSSSDLVSADGTNIREFDFTCSGRGFCLVNYKPDSFSLRNNLLRYELYFCDSSLNVTARRVIQLDQGYMLHEVTHFQSSKALLKWRKRINPKREPDLMVLVSATEPGLRYLRPDLQGKEVNNFYVQELQEGELAVSGYYTDPQTKATLGMFLFLYQPADLKLIRSALYPIDIRFHYAGATPEQRAKRQFQHQITHLYEADSGRIVLIGEFRSYEQAVSTLRTQNQQGKNATFTQQDNWSTANPESKIQQHARERNMPATRVSRGVVRNGNDQYIHGASYAYCIDSDGSLKWTNLIPVNQTAGFGESEFISVAYTFHNNALYLVYNDQIDGHIKSTITSSTIIEGSCQQTLVRIGINGEIRKEELSQQIKRQRLIPGSSHQTSEGILLVNGTPAEYNFLLLRF